MVAVVGPSYTPVPYPSRGHISKTKQDKPIVSMKHYKEIDTADSFAALAFRPPRRSPGEIFGFQIQNMCIY